MYQDHMTKGGRPACPGLPRSISDHGGVAGSAQTSVAVPSPIDSDGGRNCITLQQLRAKVVLYGLGDKGCIDHHQVRLQQFPGLPAEGPLQAFVLAGQSRRRQHPAVGIDVQRDTGTIKPIDRVVFPCRNRGDDLQVCRRADLQVDALAPQILDQARVLDAPRAVADSGGLQQAQRFPNALRATRLARVRRAEQSVFPGISISAQVSIEGKPASSPARSSATTWLPRKPSTRAAVCRLWGSVKWRSLQSGELLCRCFGPVPQSRPPRSRPHAPPTGSGPCEARARTESRHKSPRPGSVAQRALP